MLSIEEYLTGETYHDELEATTPFSEYFYAILLNEKSDEVYVSEYSNIFMLLDLILNHELLSNVTIYRTQRDPPTREQIESITDTLQNH